MSETAPLLDCLTIEPSPPKDIYNRFPISQKRRILTLVSLAATIVPFASRCFIPCVPQVARDLKTSGTVINYNVGAYIFMDAVGNLFCALYADFYGRRLVYLVSLPLLCLGALGTALSVNVIQLFVSRTIEALGASCTISVGVAIISDIYSLEERGTAVGIFLATLDLGAGLSPWIGGVTASYISWSTMQMLLFAVDFSVFIATAIFLPETSHSGSRGIEKLLAQEVTAGLDPSSRANTQARRFVPLNPFKQLAILRGPNILLVGFAGAFVLVTSFVLIIPMSFIFQRRYDIISPAIIGACLLVPGLGSIVGAPFAGRMSDRVVIKGRQNRSGKWVCEDRLIPALPGELLVPVTLLVFGLVTRFFPRTIGLITDLLCLFMNGLGEVLVIATVTTYSVGVLHSRSAEAMAVGYFFCNSLCGIVAAVVLPAIDNMGIGATNGLAAMLGWFAFGLLWITIRYGESLRAWVDLGYTDSVQDS